MLFVDRLCCDYVYAVVRLCVVVLCCGVVVCVLLCRVVGD